MISDVRIAPTPKDTVLVDGTAQLYRVRRPTRDPEGSPSAETERAAAPLMR